MEKLRRGDFITIDVRSKEGYPVTNKHHTAKLEPHEDYNIYLTGVNFLDSGFIKGTYMGEEQGHLYDAFCRPVQYHPATGWLQSGRGRVEAARMITVKNKQEIMVVIEAD